MEIGRDETSRAPLEQDLSDEGFSPNGTLLFVLLMLLGYALYWGWLWFIVTLQRGVGV